MDNDEISAESVSKLKNIAAETGHASVEDLVREIIETYAPLKTPTAEEMRDALEGAYQQTAEAAAEAWGRGLLTR